MIPLTMADLGEEKRIMRISGNSKIRRHLENLGFVVGTYVTVISMIGGNIIVNVRESRVAISREMAAKIMI